MKKFLLSLVFIIFTSLYINGQSKNFTYIQFDIAASLTGNPERYESEDYPNQKNKDWFVPNGLGTKVGYGVHYKKWLTLGIHSGIDWKWDGKLVTVPVFLNLGLNPKVGEETRIMLQAGYGKGFAIGRGDLSGLYRRAKLGIGSDDFILFAEISDYDFPFKGEQSAGSISIGITLTDFFYYKAKAD